MIFVTRFASSPAFVVFLPSSFRTLWLVVCGWWLSLRQFSFDLRCWPEDAVDDVDASVVGVSPVRADDARFHVDNPSAHNIYNDAKRLGL